MVSRLLSSCDSLERYERSRHGVVQQLGEGHLCELSGLCATAMLVLRDEIERGVALVCVCNIDVGNCFAYLVACRPVDSVFSVVLIHTYYE